MVCLLSLMHRQQPCMRALHISHSWVLIYACSSSPEDHQCRTCSSPALSPHSCMAFSWFSVVVPHPLFFSLHSSPGFTLDSTTCEALGPKSEHMRILVASPVLLASTLRSFMFPNFSLRKFVASSTVGSSRAWLLRMQVLESTRVHSTTYQLCKLGQTTQLLCASSVKWR